MRKKNASLILAGAIAATALASNVHAEYETKPKMDSQTMSDDSYKPAPNEKEYWEAKKAEMQKKSSEMRAKKVAELKAKGVDVSSITPELLDAAKTDEGKFWEALKKIMNAHELESRKEFLEKLKAQGIDVSSITDDVLADGAKFWEAVKKLQKAKAGEYEKKHEEKKKYEEEKWKHEEKKKYEDRKPPVVSPTANPLSPKLRKTLETKLRAIPDEKKAEFYERAKAILTAHIEKATAAKNTKLVAKLQAILAIVEDITGPGDAEDSAIIDAIFNSGTTSQ